MIKFLLDSTIRYYSYWNGGSAWSGWCSYISSFRYIGRLDISHGIDYAKWGHYERAALHASHRYMHRDFCIVVNRPEWIRMDDRNQPHSATVASIRWRDGVEYYHWHGLRVPGWWITNPERLTAEIVLSERNVELRRAAAEIVGWGKLIEQLTYRVIDEHHDPEIGTLIEVDLPDSPGERFLRVRCGTGRDFCLAVDNKCTTSLEAQAWLYDVDIETIEQLRFRT